MEILKFTFILSKQNINIVFLNWVEEGKKIKLVCVSLIETCVSFNDIIVYYFCLKCIHCRSKPTVMLIICARKALCKKWTDQMIHRYIERQRHLHLRRSCTNFFFLSNSTFALSFASMYALQTETTVHILWLFVSWMLFPISRPLSHKPCVHLSLTFSVYYSANYNASEMNVNKYPTNIVNVWIILMKF